LKVKLLMIIFKKIKFKNFGSFGNNWTEIELNKKQSTLVCGSNGSGKSFALLDSITFALFGKSFRKINLTQLNNSINKKNCLTELEFDVEKDQFKIIRGLSPKIFEIYKNGKLINQDAKSLDYQDVLEQQILKMNYKTFTQVVILGSSSFVPFMQLTAADRRAVIENILDINIFTTMNIVLKTKINNSKENLLEITNKLDLQNQTVEYQQKIVNNLVNRMSSDISKLNEEILNHKNEISIYENKITELDEKKSKLIIDSNISIDKKTYSENDKKISKLTYELSSFEDEIKFYDKTDKCPKCKVKITEDMKKKNLSTLHEKIDLIEKQFIVLESDNKILTDKIDSYEKTLEKIKDYDDEIKEYNFSKRELNSLIQYKMKQVEESAKIENDIIREKNNLKKEKENLSKLKIEKEDLKQELEYLKLAGDILKDNGVKIKIIKHYLPAMNKFINKYLKAMDFFVQFNIDEEFNEVIKSRYRDEFGYMNFSEGEKMRIDLALLLAWRDIAKMKNSVNCNLLILDEIFDSSLDSGGIDEVLKLLNALGSKTNVFVISHKADQIVDKFTNTLTFEKKNNFSKISNT
jgi:DNA repair exonuclease SbcCD ATPase subunit